MRQGTILCALVFAFTLVCRAAGAAAPDPSDIFAKHTAAVGYSLSDGRAKPYLLETITSYADSKAQTRTVRKQAGAYFFVQSTYNGRSHAYGFDGRSFWSQNSNGNIVQEIGYGRRYSVTWAVIHAEAFGPDVSPQMLADAGNDYVVRINPPSGAPADIYFNKSTYYIDRVVVDPLLENIQEDYSNYKRFGAIAIAMTQTYKDEVTNVSRFVWDAPLPADDFNAPISRHYATFPATGSTAVPFDDRQSSVVFEATLNGVKGRFMLDTGAAGVYLTRAFAAKANLQPLGAATVTGVGGNAETSVTRIDHFAIGGVELQSFYAFIGIANLGADGIVGFDVLDQVVCDVDFDKKQLTISNPATFTAPPGRGALVVALDGQTPQIEALVNNKLQVFMDLDTGDGSSMTFTRTFVDHNPGIVTRAGEARFVGAGGETQSGYIGSLDEIDIGPYKFFGLEADVLGGFSGFAANRETQGLVGYQMLRRFNLTFDYRDNKVYLDLSKYGKSTKF